MGGAPRIIAVPPPRPSGWTHLYTPPTPAAADPPLRSLLLLNPDTAATPPTRVTRFAVTGTSGFVGRHLVAYLLRQGHRITCISRHGTALPGTEHRPVRDYLDVPALTQAMAGAEAVIHLAARAHMLNDTAASPEQAFREANLDGALAVARAARSAGVARLVLVSSIGVNGNATRGRAFTAADRPEPAEPYAVSKWDGEQAVTRELADSPTGLVILRPTLVYGADCPGNFRLLLNLVHRLPIVPLGALTRRRSLIHVDNLCDALSLAALHPGALSRTFLLSDGQDLSVAEVARILCRAFGKNPTRVVAVPEGLLRALAGLAGKGGAITKLAAELAVDSTEFRAVTGWRPPLAPAEGLAQAAAGFAAARRTA